MLGMHRDAWGCSGMHGDAQGCNLVGATIVSPFYTQRNSSKAEAMHLVRGGERIRGIRIPPRGILEWPRAEAAKNQTTAFSSSPKLQGKKSF